MIPSTVPFFRSIYYNTVLLSGWQAIGCKTPSETNINATVPYIKGHRPINTASPPISGFCICGFNLCVPAKLLVMSNSVQHYGL